MMRNIHLHGHLKEAFGPNFSFDIASAGEAFRALNCAFPGRFIAEMKKGSYAVVRGDPDDGMSIKVEHLNEFRLGGASDLHIIPIAAGSKGSSAKGTLEIALGVAIIGAAIFFSGGTLAAPLSGLGTAITVGGTALPITWGNIAAIGLAVTMLGVANVMSKAPVNNDNTSSYTFTGPVNVDQQGAAVPLIFGLVMCGSQAVSVGYEVEDIGEYHPPNNVPSS